MLNTAAGAGIAVVCSALAFGDLLGPYWRETEMRRLLVWSLCFLSECERQQSMREACLSSDYAVECSFFGATAPIWALVYFFLLLLLLVGWDLRH
jgi:hypothetical protein